MAAEPALELRSRGWLADLLPGLQRQAAHRIVRWHQKGEFGLIANPLPDAEFEYQICDERGFCGTQGLGQRAILGADHYDCPIAGEQLSAETSHASEGFVVQQSRDEPQHPDEERG